MKKRAKQKGRSGLGFSPQELSSDITQEVVKECVFILASTTARAGVPGIFQLFSPKRGELWSITVSVANDPKKLAQLEALARSWEVWDDRPASSAPHTPAGDGSP